MKELVLALRAIAKELKRHNDILSPPQIKRKEAELGKASYYDAEERDTTEQLNRIEEKAKADRLRG